MMRRQRSRAALVCAVAVVAALVLVAVPVAPAAADHEPPAESHDPAGSGSLEGTELVGDQAGFPCFRVARSVFGIRGGGTYEGRTASGDPVVYQGQINAQETLHEHGPLQVQIENTEAYYHSPFGTHGTEAGGGAGCSASTVATPVPAEFRVFAAEAAQDTDGDEDVDVLSGAAWVYRLNEAGEKVPCRAQGTFARGTKESPAFGDTAWVAEWTLDEACVVVGNEAGTPGTGTAPRGTFHTQHGVHEPCFGDIDAGDCPRIIRVDYAQFLPKPGPFLTVSGPSSAVIGCDQPVTVNARLTVDGVAEPDVPVTFSVTGPAPAAPAAGAGVTGADGRAAFTFGAAAPGDYTVTARANHGGLERVATHTVRFDQLPPLSVILSGPAKGQTEDATTVRATVRDACGALSGALVSFSVAWPAQDKPWTGQATPSSGTATTDAVGEAEFSFSGDRAGSYTVTATTSLGTQQASATHTADLAINTLKRIESTPVSVDGEQTSRLSVIDPAGAYAYFATGPNSMTSPSVDRIVKFDLATFEPVDVLMVPNGISSLVIDPGGDYAYAGQFGLVYRIDLATFELAGSFALPRRPGGTPAYPVVTIIDPAGDYAYVGIRGSYVSQSDPSGWYTAQVLKIDLNTSEVVGALDMDLEEESDMFTSALMDPGGASAYFSFRGEALGARVVKIDLSTFQRASHVTLDGYDESEIDSGLIDPAGDFAYYGTTFSSPGRIVKVDLRTMTRVDAITLNVDRTELGPYPVDRTEKDLYSAVMDPAGRFAYFVTQGTIANWHPAARDRPSRMIRIDLSTFTRAASVDLPHATENHTMTAVIDPTGTHAYLGTSHVDAVERETGPPYPGLVAKVRLDRQPSPALAADGDSYSTEYGSPLTVSAPGVLAGDADADGDPLVAGQASDAAGGSVTLNQDGSFSYTPDAGFSGTDSFTYTASDGIDYSAPATVTIVVAPPKGPTGSAFGFSSSVSLFGGAAQPRGPSPTVMLPATGSVTPVTATAPQGDAVYGPAKLFTSGQLDVSTEGTTASVTSSATVANVNRSLDEKFTAANVASTCTATPTGVTGSTTITNGVLEVSEGDPNVDGDETRVTIPTEPLPNTSYEGQLESVGDRFRYVFNEQVRNPDGSITVYAAHQYLLGPTAVGDLYIGKSECGVPQTAVPELGAVADFDGDGATDVSVFRPSTGVWYLRQSTDGDRAVEFGVDGDVPVPGDYDGDGTTDLGVYRPSNGVWYLRQSTDGDTASPFGAGGDVPVPGDYDGDGATDLGVYRPSTGVWYLRQSTAGDRATPFGAEGDVATPGDYDGDGTTDLAVFRPSTGVWYARQSTAGDRSSEFGATGDVPLPGDYDGDGTTDVGVYRPSTGTWYLRQSTGGDAASGFGATGDLPVPGDYDGDGTTDLGVHRPETNVWYLRRSTTGDTATQFGAPGDIPLPLPAAIRQSALG